MNHFRPSKINVFDHSDVVYHVDEKVGLTHNYVYTSLLCMFSCLICLCLYLHVRIQSMHVQFHSLCVGQDPLTDGLSAVKVFLFVRLQNVFILLHACSALFLRCMFSLCNYAGQATKKFVFAALGSGHSTVLGA